MSNRYVVYITEDNDRICWSCARQYPDRIDHHAYTEDEDDQCDYCGDFIIPDTWDVTAGVDDREEDEDWYNMKDQEYWDRQYDGE